MDKLAAELGMDPVEFRQLNAMSQGTDPAHRPGGRLPGAGRRTAAPGQGLPAAAGAAVGDRRRGAGRPRAARRRCPTPRTARASCAASATRSASRTSASPRASTTTPPPGSGWRSIGGEPVAIVHTAMAEVGQGGVTVHAQIARTELGVAQVTIQPGRHPGRLGRLHLRLPADVHDRRRGQEHLRGRAREGPRAGPPQVRHATTPAGPPPNCCWRAARSSPTRARCWPTWRTCWATRRSTWSWSTGTGRPRRSTCAPARATATSSTPSPRTARWSRWTSNWAWSRWSSWPAPRTSARRSTRCRSIGQIQGGTTQGLGLAVMEEIVVDPGRRRCATRPSPTT